jgi:hypothetical protein
MQEGKIGKSCLAGAAALDLRGICDAPGERQHIDFIFVFGVDGFPFDVSDLCKDI